MIHVTKAIYSGGVLRPDQRLDLPEDQRVQIIVQPINHHQMEDREIAIKRLLDHVNRSAFSYSGPLPTRDELHDRF
jgi:predicted DNA-binding antitoxin AbrB/MazE fold protein